MTEYTRDAPDETWQALIAGLEDFLGKDSALAQKIRDRALPTVGLEVFTLTLRDVLDGERTSAAKPAGWRFITTGAEEVLAGDVTEVPEEMRQRMTSLSRDPKLATVVPFLYELRDLPKVPRDGQYDVMLLRIPAVLLDAFWLKSRTGAGDLIIPVLSAAMELRTRQVYEPDEFFAVVRTLAERFREFDEIAE